MAKYDELIIEHSEAINYIKSLRAKQDEISKRLDGAYESFREDLGPIDCETIEDEMAQNQIELSQAQESLSNEIDLAYWDVPFAKTRKQGIVKFWQLSRLNN